MAKTIVIFPRGNYLSVLEAFAKIRGDFWSSYRVLITEEPDAVNSGGALVLPRASSMMYSSLLFSPAWEGSIRNYRECRKPILLICGSLIVFVKELGNHCEGRSTFAFLDVRADNDSLNGDFEVFCRSGEKSIGNFTSAPLLSKVSSESILATTATNQVVAVCQDSIFGYSYHDPEGVSYLPFLRAI